MVNLSANQGCKIGIIGLGVMGRNLLLNIADHNFPVAGYDSNVNQVETLRQITKDPKIIPTDTLSDFIKALQKPRAVLLLVPSGHIVDTVIQELVPYLQKGDTIIDAGNSYFKDTNLRAQLLAEKGIQYLGIGVSGGEEGARHGPCFMPGGPKETYEALRTVFEAAAAKVNGDPCVAYLGPGSVGHYVKMVHNGIEYGIMQLIAETYDLMKRRLGLNNEELQKVYTEWNRGELNSYLLEITGHIFAEKDPKTRNHLIDDILGVAKQKGTGMWTTQSAMELEVPLPTIDVAVGMRDLSKLHEQRQKVSKLFSKPIRLFEGNKETFLKQLQHAFYVSMVMAYTQGMALLKVASDKYLYHLDLEAVARIWRGGCIIRSAFLEDIRHAYRQDPNLPNLLLDPQLLVKVKQYEEDLRCIVSDVANSGVPTPGFMTALSYLDGYRSPWLPTNLIQAQRDYFGAHTFERIDAKGTFHIDWEEGKGENE